MALLRALPLPRSLRVNGAGLWAVRLFLRRAIFFLQHVPALAAGSSHPFVGLTQDHKLLTYHYGALSVIPSGSHFAVASTLVRDRRRAVIPTQSISKSLGRLALIMERPFPNNIGNPRCFAGSGATFCTAPPFALVLADSVGPDEHQSVAPPFDDSKPITTSQATSSN